MPIKFKGFFEVPVDHLFGSTIFIPEIQKLNLDNLAAKLTTLKTESFSFTFARDLNKSKYSIGYGVGKGFTRTQRCFLVGPGDSSTTWEKEARIAKKQNLESIVLFALDQFCLIGYPVPFWKNLRKGRRL